MTQCILTYNSGIALSFESPLRNAIGQLYYMQFSLDEHSMIIRGDGTPTNRVETMAGDAFVVRSIIPLHLLPFIFCICVFLSIYIFHP